MANRGKSKSDKDRDSIVQDRLQIILTRMLQDEDNKYCVDCDSKGPRWASWNLGIFMCIRCAGIHRNLGVHISRVKSVNLDSWTPQQVASMQLMGNSRARAVYEALVPEDFRRPQTDSQLEQFIRAKYEKKKYIAREWVPSKVPEFPRGWNELVEAEKLKKDPKTVVLTAPTTTSVPATAAVQAKSPLPVAKPAQTSTVKLPLSVAVPQPKDQKDITSLEPVSAGNSLASDLLGLSMGSGISASISFPATKPAPVSAQSNYANDLLGLGDSTSSASNHSSDLDFFGLSSAPASNNNNGIATTNLKSDQSNFFGADLNDGFTGNSGTGSANQDSTKMSKDSIMALFNKPAQQNFQPAAPLPQHQQQLPGFMTEMNQNISSPFGNFGLPHSGHAVPTSMNYSALNNPFMTLSSVLATNTASNATPKIDQSRNSAFAGLDSHNFFQ